MLTVVRRAVPVSTRQRRGSTAAAAAGVHQQPSCSTPSRSRTAGAVCSFYQTSTATSAVKSGAETGPKNIFRLRSTICETNNGASRSSNSNSNSSGSGSGSRVGRPKHPTLLRSSSTCTKSGSPFGSPRWRGEGKLAARGSSHSSSSYDSPNLIFAPCERRVISRSSSSSCVSKRNLSGASASGLRAQTRRAGTERLDSGAASSSGGINAGDKARMTAHRHASSGGGTGGAGGAGGSGRRWLWTAAAVTAVTAVTATVTNASTTSCKSDRSTWASSTSGKTKQPLPSAESRNFAGVQGGVGRGRGKGCDCGCGGIRKGGADCVHGGGDHDDRNESGGKLTPVSLRGDGGDGEDFLAGVTVGAGRTRDATSAALNRGYGDPADETVSPTSSTAAGSTGHMNGGWGAWVARGVTARAAGGSAGLEEARRGPHGVYAVRGGARGMSAVAGAKKEDDNGGGVSAKGDRGARDSKAGDGVPFAGRPLFTSVTSTKGHRPHMEDEFFLSTDGSFSAVYDGHGGPNVSKYLRRNLYKHFMDHLPPGADAYDVKSIEVALQAAFKSADDYVVRHTPYGNEGSCAVSVTVHCDQDGKASLISANLGDSRAVLSRGGKALDLTEDHKPNSPKEMERIYRHDGMVTWEGFECAQGLQIEGTGVYRINGSLAVARAIGDIDYRPWVSAEAEIKTIDINRETDQFVILASDGLWDVMTSAEAVAYVHAIMGGAMGAGREVGEAGDDPKSEGDGDGEAGGDGAKTAAGTAGSGSESGERPAHMTLVNWTQSYAEDRGMIRAATMLRKKKMARYLTAEALRRGSMDNTTVAVVWLQ